jgi:hypothetical protein
MGLPSPTCSCCAPWLTTTSEARETARADRKIFNSDKPEKLGLMQQAITNTYNPHDVPVGMLAALEAAFAADPNDLPP